MPAHLVDFLAWSCLISSYQAYQWLGPGTACSPQISSPVHLMIYRVPGPAIPFPRSRAGPHAD